MKGKPKKKVTHLRKKKSLPFYLIAKPTSPTERQQNREILEMAEKIRFEKEQLAMTHYPNENPVIHLAFLFCLYAGLRFCDVKDLTFAQVDFSNRFLRFNQVKTAGHSSASWVNMPLSDTHLKLMGEPENGDKSQLIFPLPSHTMCLKALRHWTTRAGIEKHHTEKYTRAVDSLKREAIDSLPDISF